MDNIDIFEQWVLEIAEKTPRFVQQMKLEDKAGKYKFSLSGDILSANVFTGLAQATFAVRILFILKNLRSQDAIDLQNFINRFKKGDGSYFDDYIQKLTRWRRTLQTIKHLDLKYIDNFYIKNAETRQALAALINMDNDTCSNYFPFNASERKLASFVHSLNWKKPWSAASHVNHLLFFTKFNERFSEDKKDIIFSIIEKNLRRYYQKDGFVYEKCSADSYPQKIGGMMKTLMGLSLIGREANWISPQIVDLCLDKIKPNDACENFNTIFVLGKCKKLAYRIDQITDFVLQKALSWRENYYWPELGGFSFYKGRSQNSYYGANISKGLPEPDMHGTAMFVWGIYVISETLSLNEKLNLRKAVL